MVKEYFKKNNVAYQDYNVADDHNARHEMFHLSHQEGVPVIDIEGTIIVGFNRSEIDKALKIKH